MSKEHEWTVEEPTEFPDTFLVSRRGLFGGIARGLVKGKFLEATLRFAGGAAAEEFIRRSVWNWAKDVPDFLPEERRGYPLPGWLETSLPERPALVTEDGHQAFLRQAVMHQPLVTEVFARSFNHILQRREPNPPSMGELFMQQINISKEVLQRHHPGEINWEDVVHVAILSQAGIFSNYFSLDELKSLGVLIPGKYSSNDKPGLMSEYLNNIPKVFPATPSNCDTPRDNIARCDGNDRNLHWANNLALAYEYYFAKKWGLQDAERVPNGVKFFFDILDVLYPGSIERKMMFLDRAAQYFWETKEAWDFEFGKPGEYGLNDDGTKIRSGFFFDPLTKNDLMANELGLRVAFELRENVTEEKIHQIAGYLDNESFYRISENNKRDILYADLGTLPIAA